MPVPQYNTDTGQLPFVLGQTDSNTVVRTVVQTIGFVSSVAPATFTVLAANRLYFSQGQSATHNYVYIDVGNNLGLVGTSGYNWEIDIIQYIGFKGPRTVLPCTNHIGFENFCREATILSVQNNLSFIDHTGSPVYPETETALHQAYIAANNLGFTQVLVGAQVEDLYQYMGLNDSVTSIGTDFTRASAQSCIKQHLTYTISGSPCPEKEYTPFIGESGDSSYGSVSTTPPTLTTGTLTLTYPKVTPTLTLVLKNPVMGNTDNLTFRVINRRTRGGDQILFGDPKWSKTQIQAMTIDNVCSTDLDNLVSFINSSLGKEIGLLDWEGRNWTGVIIAPQTEITKKASGFSVTLEFQGDLD